MVGLGHCVRRRGGPQAARQRVLCRVGDPSWSIEGRWCLPGLRREQRSVAGHSGMFVPIAPVRPLPGRRRRASHAVRLMPVQFDARSPPPMMRNASVVPCSSRHCARGVPEAEYATDHGTILCTTTWGHLPAHGSSTFPDKHPNAMRSCPSLSGGHQPFSLRRSTVVPIGIPTVSIPPWGCNTPDLT